MAPQDTAGTQGDNDKLTPYKGCTNVTDTLINTSKLREMTRVECAGILSQSGGSKQIVCLIREIKNRDDRYLIGLEREGIMQ